jgi:NTE family protein
LSTPRVHSSRAHTLKVAQQMKTLGVSSKLNGRMDFLLHLKEIGRQATDRWINTHFDAIGERSTINIREKFL